MNRLQASVSHVLRNGSYGTKITGPVGAAPGGQVDRKADRSTRTGPEPASPCRAAAALSGWFAPGGMACA